MHKVRAWLRWFIASSLYYSGLLWLYATFRLRGRAVALMYHRVLPSDADTFSSSGIIVSPSSFEIQLGFLRRHFTLLTAQEFTACLARGAFPRRACIVTFDDGWSDNERYALPILARFHAPAIVFVATAYVGRAVTFWQEEMTRLLFQASRLPGPPAPLLEELGLADACRASDGEARRLARDLVTRFKSTNNEETSRLIGRLRTILGHDGASGTALGDDRFLSWDAVRRLANSGLVAIGSHADSHVPLTRLGHRGATADLLRSRQEIESQELPTPVLCAYPNGDHDADVMSAAVNAGFAVGFTTVGGHILPSDDPLRLRRINVHESAGATRAEFLCRVLGLF